MPHISRRYYYYGKEMPKDEARFYAGTDELEKHPLFGKLKGSVYMRGKYLQNKGSIAAVDSGGAVYVNVHQNLEAAEWEYVVAHCLLHLAFGHFDSDKIPRDANGEFRADLWNLACDIYVTRFLSDIRYGEPVVEDPAKKYRFKMNDEVKIYYHLLESEIGGQEHIPQSYGLNGLKGLDMAGLSKPVSYKEGEKNEYAHQFAWALARSVTDTVSRESGNKRNAVKETVVTKAAGWFLTHYPLLGGVAASFKIIEDVDICQKYEIHIAAVDAELGEIYVNPVANLSEKEWRFVLAHEYLHAGLEHHKRCQGRDRYLWNIACDYVVNGWLHEMEIGDMPGEGLLYDEELKGLSAETIYDRIVKEIRKYTKMNTFRGFGKGDIMGGAGPGFAGMGKGVSLDEFFKNALREGLDYQLSDSWGSKSRGYLPAGLVEEIRALTMPPIPWEVELAKWFDEQFPPVEKHRSYARPSRRQGATPDIPRPSYVIRDEDRDARTFGVVIDTSGSMSDKQIGMALGSVASYAAAKEVPLVRVVFCDAEATDAGYLSPEDLAGRVKVTGRGGTVLQPALDLYQKMKDFPKNGPILIITDGYIENRLHVRREHAYLIPKGNRLPFQPKGKVFYFK